MANDVTARIIKRAQRGDPAAITEIYNTYVDKIYRYVAYRVGSDVDAEDLTAEVFTRMLEALPKYKDTGAPFESWLYRIAAARIADFYRARKRHTEIGLTDNIVSDTIHPEQSLQDEQEQKQLRDALQQLSDDDQAVLIMRFVERKSHHQVAEILDKSVSAVKSIQHRALLRLAQELGSEEKIRHYLRGEANE